MRPAHCLRKTQALAPILPLLLSTLMERMQHGVVRAHHLISFSCPIAIFAGLHSQELAKFHSDDYVDFLETVTLQNMESQRVRTAVFGVMLVEIVCH